MTSNGGLIINSYLSVSSNIILNALSFLLILIFQGEPDGKYKYDNLCTLLLTFDRWSDKSKRDFITTFYDTYRLLGYECSRLVECLCVSSCCFFIL